MEVNKGKLQYKGEEHNQEKWPHNIKPGVLSAYITLL